MSQNSAVSVLSNERAGHASQREASAIYQKGRVVARVENAQADLQNKVIKFDEIFNSDYLLLPDECEFQNYRLLVRQIEYATKVEKTAMHKGRILRGVTAEILGYLEQ
jgi:hypothetical protein